MLFAEAGKNLLVRFMVGPEGDGGVFLHQTEKARRYLFLLALLRHLDRHAQARLREGDRSELQYLFGLHSVSPVRIFESFVTTPISPAAISEISSCFAPRTEIILPMRSLSCVRAL